jgi:hypothetical protein
LRLEWRLENGVIVTLDTAMSRTVARMAPTALNMVRTRFPKQMRPRAEVKKMRIMAAKYAMA